MADYFKIANLARNGDVQRRILVGLDNQAFDILSEDIGTPNHANRLAWAQTVRDNANYGGSVEVVVRTLFSQYPNAVALFKEHQGAVHVADEAGLATAIDGVMSDFIDDYLAK